jgi:putative DNA primase/helicase
LDCTSFGWRLHGNYLCCCPAHDDATPSLSIKADGDGGVLVNCFAGCTTGAVFDAFRRKGLLQEDASTESAGDTADSGASGGEDEGKEPEPEPESEDPAEAANKALAEEREKKLAAARAKFQKGWAAFGAQSALHTVVDNYCEWRGVSRFATAPIWARFTPSGQHVGRDKNGQRFEQFFPMLLIAGVNPTTGELYGGQREYLAYGGRGFAPVDKKSRKKTAPGCSLRGAVARMAEPVDGEFLVVGEGWVTVRTVMDATGLSGWSVFGTSGLASFDPPESVKAVLFLSDNDADGHSAKALATVCPRLFERGIKIGVAKAPPGVNDFNDLVRLRDDGTRLHGTVEAGLKAVSDIIKEAKARARVKGDGADAATGAAVGAASPRIDLPGFDDEDDKKFSMTPNGLYRGRMFVCRPFEILARARAATEGKAPREWGLFLRFKDYDGVLTEEPIPGRALHSDPGAIASNLEAAGLHINTIPAARGALVAYLGTVETKNRIFVAKRTGWVTINGGPVFVLPDQTIGSNSERIALSRETTSVAAYAKRGTLAEWQAKIGTPAGEHLLLQFGISVALAGPLLKMSGGESGGFHLFGDSSTGKTTTARVAASCWGKGSREDEDGYMKTWSSTANGLEAVFSSASDTCLVLDELAQLAAGEAATVVYALTGGKGKQRLRADASARPSYTWRTILFSTGEPPLSARVDEDRQKLGRKGLQGGSTVRVIDIPADRTHGAFDRVAGEKNFDAAAFAKEMERRAQTVYGVAGPAFIEALIHEKVSGDDVREFVDAFVKDALKNVHGDYGQVGRVAAKFGLVAFAGTLACTLEIVNWNAKAFVKNMKGLFCAWLRERGTSGPIETALVVRHIRDFLEVHGGSGFDSVDEPEIASLKERPASKRFGYRNGQGEAEVWHIFPGVFRREIFEGISPKKAAQILARLGVLEKGNEPGRFDKKVQPHPSVQRQRFYVVTARLFEDFDISKSSQAES